MALASENWSERDVVLVSAEYLRAFGATSEAAQLYQRLLELMGDNREEFTDEQLLLWATASLHAEKFEQCISLEPRAASDTRHRLQLGLIRAQALIALDIWEEALVEYQTLAADAPRDREVLDGLMTVAFRLNRPEIAIAPLQSFVDAGDGDAHDYANLAVLYALAGDKEASVRRTRKSIELSPDDPLVLRRGIQLLLRNGRVDLAVENINLYLAKFKEEEDFVQVWTGSPDELSQKFIKEVVLPAVERHQKIGELYQRHPLPLGMLAKAAGRSYINMWHGVRRGELNAPFQVNRARDFAGNALEIARSADSVVIGESALLTLGLLDLLSALAEVFEEAKIPLEVNDDVREELIRAESQLLRSVSESIQRHRQFAIVNAGSSRLFDADIREALGDQEVSALTLASELGVPLLDDDQGLRDLASGREVRSFGVRSLLEIMLERSIIDGRLYSRSVARLAAENYYFIPYNGQVLMDTILGADFEESPEVRALVSMIWKGDADVASYIGVYGSAICGLWQHTPVGREVSRDEWTRRLLAQLSMRGDIFMPLRAMARVIALIAIHDPKQLPTLCFNLLNICTVQLGIEDAYVLGVLAAVVRSLSAAPHHGIATAQLVISSIGIYWQARLKRLLRSQDQHLHDLLFPLELPD